jgi:creatinase
MTNRPQHYRFHQGPRILPFAPEEYDARLEGLRDLMEMQGIDACLFTSMPSIAYYSGFLYCAFGRPYGLVVTATQSVTISAGIDAGQPWRRCHGDNLTYTDWARDTYWRAVASVTGEGRVIGCEADHLTLVQSEKLNVFLKPKRGVDISRGAMEQRMVKSAAEIDLIRQGAAVADVGGFAIREAVKSGLREIDVAMAGRDAMELEIARRFPQAEYRDTWVWFQSGINTDGAHNPVTSRKLQHGDILSMSAFPMISGYHAALQRTMFVAEVDPASNRIWDINVAAHAYGKSLLVPGTKCSEVTEKLNRFFHEHEVLHYRTCGYGHSFGLLSHHYGREAGLDLREDIDTVLEPGMVISMAPMLTIPEGQPGAGGYREHDTLIITEDGNEDITAYPCGPAFNIVG